MSETLNDIRKSFDSIISPKLLTPDEIISKFKEFFPIIKEFLEKLDSNSFYKEENFSNIEKMFFNPLPIEPSSWETIIVTLKEEIIPRFNSIANEKFLAYIPADPAPPALIGAMLTPIFNQFVGSVIGSPGGVAIESLALHWIKEMMDYPLSAGACFTSGGSMANLTCLYSGITKMAPWIKEQGLFGNKIPLVYCSDQTHNSIIKALLILGLGKKNIRIIESNSDFTINVEKLKIMISKDMNNSSYFPAIIVANAGTTNTGAIDDLEKISKISLTYNMWFHVDAAYGGFARISDTPATKLLAKINLANSIALDAHKWLFIPFEAGMALVKNRDHLKNAFSEGSEYLKDSQDFLQEQHLMINFWEYSFQLTREFRGLKVWILIMAYGREGLSNFITKNILLSKYFKARIIEHKNLEMMAESELSIVCFRWVSTDEFNDKIIDKIQKNKNYYVSRTLLKGRITIRVCIVNLTSTPETIDGLVNEINSIALSLKS